jgi:hypothetical protein
MTLRRIETKGYTPAVVRDQPQPMMIWAKISDLRVDDRYQRALSVASKRAIQRIADDFDWRRYQPILVAPAGDGAFAIVDGQHRAHAAAVAGLESIPAMTVPMTVQQQAINFSAINRTAIKVSALQIYRAELAAGMDWAIKCRDAVADAGCTLLTYNPNATNRAPHTLTCVQLIRTMVKSGETAAITAGLRAIRNSNLAALHAADGSTAHLYGTKNLRIWLTAVAINNRFLKIDLTAAYDDFDLASVIEEAHATARTTGQPPRDTVILHLRDHLRTYLPKDTDA